MRVSVTDVHAGESVPVRVDEAPVGVPVTVTLQWEMGSRAVSSRAVFISNRRGEVDPTHQPSMAGSYLGLDTHGLFWSARDERGSAPDGSVESDDVEVYVEAVCGPDRVSATFRRLLIRPGVIESTVDVGAAQAVLFSHTDGPAPAVLVLGGSGGGIASTRRTAAFLAGRGFSTLALPYFGAPGLPQDLELIPVESALVAVDTLLSSRHTVGNHIGVLGISRGSELALLTAAHHAHVAAVVGLAPSPYVWSGVRADGTSAQSAWSLGGLPLPHVPDAPDSESFDAAVTEANPNALGPYFERCLAFAGTTCEALIPLSNDADTLMVNAAQDLVWPSTHFLTLARQEWDDTSRLTEITYPRVGHRLSSIASDPISAIVTHLHDGFTLPMGGDPAATAAAAIAVWDEVSRFLITRLR